MHSKHGVPCPETIFDGKQNGYLPEKGARIRITLNRKSGGQVVK
jgi:hypothetical protein